ncbi:MAG: SH3 domain-containing protein, partial [Anaerolineae bacterium]|nr:SH3 domain-containing protein [Anaerolineae bacterium]
MLFVSHIPPALVGTDTRVFLRAIPATTSTIELIVNRTAPFRPIGRTEDSQWLQVTLDDGSSGWISNPGISDVESLPVTGVSQITPNVVLVQTDGEPLYSESGDVIQTQLAYLTPITIDARSEDNMWLHVSSVPGPAGWLRADAVSGLEAIDTLAQQTFALNVESVAADTDRVVSEEDVNGVVQSSAGGLRLRQYPSSEATILLNLPAGTRLVARGRTVDDAWLLIDILEGYSGWVSTQYIELQVSLTTIPTINDSEPVPFFIPPTPENGVAVMSGIGGGAVEIFRRGREMGNRANVFTTVGDSLTDTPYFLRQ